MRTNIDIDDGLMAQALAAGPFKTKKDAVEAGLRLVARQAAYREILKWRGRLKWEGDESVDWSRPATDDAAPAAAGSMAGRAAQPAALAVEEVRSPWPAVSPAVAAATAPPASKGARRARR